MAEEAEGIPAATHHRPVGAWGRMLSLPFVVLIHLYRVTLSPVIGRQCRFEPTCSRYALEAYREHGPWLGTVLTLRRLGRCHPLCKGGYDPVPVNEPPGRGGRGVYPWDEVSQRAHAPAGPEPGGTDAR